MQHDFFKQAVHVASSASDVHVVGVAPAAMPTPKIPFPGPLELVLLLQAIASAQAPTAAIAVLRKTSVAMPTRRAEVARLGQYFPRAFLRQSGAAEGLLVEDRSLRDLVLTLNFGPGVPHERGQLCRAGYER